MKDLIEAQRSFFQLISRAEQAKRDRIEAKRRYEETIRVFEEARRDLFDSAEFIQSHQVATEGKACNWVEIAQERLDALD